MRARLGSSLVVAAFLVCGLILVWLVDVTGGRHLAANLLVSYLLLWSVAFVLSDAPREHLHGRFLATTIALGLTLVLLELPGLTRWVDYRMLFGARGEQPWLAAGNHFDEELLFVRDPGLVLESTRVHGNIAELWCLPGRGPAHSVELAYDDRGFRNDESLSRADLALIGDSYIEAVETSHADSLPRLLAASTGWSVVNLGRSGYGPQQELVVLERYALPLEPEVVVWAFYEGNDLRDLLEYEQLRSRIEAGLRTEPTLFERSLAKNLLDALSRRLEACEPNERAQLFSATFSASDGRDVPFLFVDRSDTLDETEQAALVRFESILKLAYEKTAPRGIRLVLVHVPTKYRVYRDHVRLPELSECRGWAGNDLPERLAAMARRISPEIGFLDLTSVFRAAAARGELVYLPDDTHWTVEGHRIAARALAPYLVRESRPLN